MKNLILCAAGVASFVLLNPAVAMPVNQAQMSSNSSGAANLPEKINLNQADVGTLVQSFKGIGKKRAQAIVNYRTSKGPFKSVEELADVTGFGPNFVAKHLEELQQVFTAK